MSSGESGFYSATVCACELLWAGEFLNHLGFTMTARLKEDASICIGMAMRLGPGRLKHVEIKHFALQRWVRQGRLILDAVEFDSDVTRRGTLSWTALRWCAWCNGITQALHVTVSVCGSRELFC